MPPRTQLANSVRERKLSHFFFFFGSELFQRRKMSSSREESCIYLISHGKNRKVKRDRIEVLLRMFTFFLIFNGGLEMFDIPSGTS